MQMDDDEIERLYQGTMTKPPRMWGCAAIGLALVGLLIGLLVSLAAFAIGWLI